MSTSFGIVLLIFKGNSQLEFGVLIKLSFGLKNDISGSTGKQDSAVLHFKVKQWLMIRATLHSAHSQHFCSH